MSTHMFICRHCGREVELEHELVSDGVQVRCESGHKGTVYIDGDDDGQAYAGVSWAPAEPEDDQ